MATPSWLKILPEGKVLAAIRCSAGIDVPAINRRRYGAWKDKAGYIRRITARIAFPSFSDGNGMSCAAPDIADSHRDERPMDDRDDLRLAFPAMRDPLALSYAVKPLILPASKDRGHM